MHPAYSVIFFTSASGAGYGALVWLALYAAAGGVPATTWGGLIVFSAALALITAGLLSSTFHLGHPERAWRALSQWRSSWLSREGIASIVAYVPAVVFALGWIVFERHDGAWLVAGIAAAFTALITVVCTGMIYASLRAIPRWTDPTVVPVYIGFALASGGALAFTIFEIVQPGAPEWAWAVAIVILAAWALKFVYWRRIDTAAPVATAESATGLGHIGKVTMFEAPHTGENYIMREMGYRIARKHAVKLRAIALVVGCPVPVLAFIVAGFSGGTATTAAAAVGLTALALGILVERWLFFAEARHAAMLYYGTDAV